MFVTIYAKMIILIFVFQYEINLFHSIHNLFLEYAEIKSFNFIHRRRDRKWLEDSFFSH